MSRILITLGLVLLIAGLAWPWIQKSGIGRLPGDIVYEKENFRLYFPLTSAIIISIVLSVIFWLFKK